MTKEFADAPAAQASASRLARRQRRRERSRDEILEAARRVLLREGVAATTLDLVAAEAGLSKAGLYYYFDSKDALLFELTFASHEAQAKAVEAAVEKAADGGEALRAIVRETIRTFAGQSRRFPRRLPVRSGGGIGRGQAQRRAVRAGAAAERPSAQGRDAKAQGGRRAAGRTTPDGFPGLRLRPWRAHHEGHGGEHERSARLYRRSTRGWPCFGVRGGRTRFTRVWSSKPPPGPPARIGATVKAPVAPHAVGSL